MACAISIHALREEGDGDTPEQVITMAKEISIHALREEGDTANISTT